MIAVVVDRLRRAPRRCVLAALRAYQCLVSPWLGPTCRFYPSCSMYTMEAVRRYGCLKGGWLGMRRLARCHPFHRGGIDPVP